MLYGRSGWRRAWSARGSCGRHPPRNTLTSVAAVVLDLVRPLIGVGVVVIALVRLGDQVADEEEYADDHADHEHRHDGGELEVVDHQEGDAEHGQHRQTERLGPEGPRQERSGFAREVTALSARHPLLGSVLADDGKRNGAVRAGCAARVRGSRRAVDRATRADRGSTSVPGNESFGKLERTAA